MNTKKPEDQNKITMDEKAKKEAANHEMKDFGEPVEKTYSEGVPEPTGAQKPAETIVEHPLAPTDTNPNPHGQRDEPFTAVPVKDDEGGVIVTEPDDDGPEIEATTHEVHLGDGRVLHHGARAKVHKDVAKQLVADKKAKRV